MAKCFLYSANIRGNEKNCIYPKRMEILDRSSLEKLASFDHVMARYKNDYRSNDHFMESNCIAMDVDNEHTEDEDKWIDLDRIREDFEGVTFYIVYSRNHMKDKRGKKKRPRFHLYFPIQSITDLKDYVRIKEKLIERYPYFDKNAIDGARFFFGAKNPQVEIIQGTKLVTDILHDDFKEWDESLDHIQESSRNSTMNHYAGRVLIRHGNTDEARKLFDKKSGLCSPPLSDEELEQIWKSACKFYKKVSSSEGYIPPEDYSEGIHLKPTEFSDIGQAEVFVKEYEEVVRFSPATGFLVYNGSYWEESELKAQGYSQ